MNKKCCGSSEEPCKGKATSKEKKAEKNMPEEDKVLEGLELPSRKKLEDQLTAMEMQLDESKDKALRVHAEMENLRRRVERDVANARKFGAERLLNDLLPIMDSMVRALESPESKDSHAKAMRDGMVLTLDLLEKMLAKHGVEVVAPKKGEAFNPELHEAMSTMSDPDEKINTVYEVVQKGYQLNGRILRAAMVVVIK